MESDNIDAPPPSWAFEEVHIVYSDPRWARDGMHFAAEVHALLGDWLCSPVVHVGSTAVPGLAAKPIIDLQATVSDPDAIIASNGDAMAAASWFFVPRELDQQPWRWFVVRADRPGRHRLAHLHLMQPGEPRWYQQIAFRDLLRAEPALAQQYDRLKAQAAITHARDREAYTKAKDSFVAAALARTRHHEPDPENPWINGRPAPKQNPRRP